MGRVLAAHAREPEFGWPHTHVKAPVAAGTCNPSAREVETVPGDSVACQYS